MMKTIIDADAVKLIGLQIDTLKKVRNGQITFAQWEQFNNLSPDDREARFGECKKPETTVPANPARESDLLEDEERSFVDMGYKMSYNKVSF